MTIKRFGVQLAASGIVILLGALGVSQAQREAKQTDTSQWDLEVPPTMGPPPPIDADLVNRPFADQNSYAGGADQAASAAPTFAIPDMATASGGFGDAGGGQPSGLRQVNHEETFALPPQTYVDSPASDPPAASFAGGGLSAADGPSSGLALPAWSAGNSAIADDDDDDDDIPPPAGAFAFSGLTPPAPAAPAAPARSAPASSAPGPSMPGDEDMSMSQYEAEPVNELRGGGLGGESAAWGGVAMLGGPDDGAQDDEPDDELGDDGADQASPAMTLPLATSSPAAVATPNAFANGYSAAPSGQAVTGDPVAPAYSSPPSAMPAAVPSAAPIARVASAAGTLPVMTDLAAVEEYVLNEPGDRRLDGMQAPSVVIHKRAPEQVKVGKPATFAIAVRNVGAVEALNVQVHDRVPAGMRLIDATPQPQMQGDLMLWQLGALEPGGERTISLQLVPEAEGELGSLARVTFDAAASVRTLSTRPALKITQRAPQQVLIGQQLEIELEVSNPGTGVATGVVLQTDVPDGFEHPKGRELDNLVGTLAPGEVRRQVLRLRAVAPGLVENLVRLVADDDLTASDAVTVEVVAPQLAIELEGPARRFLERQATYQINIANVGSAEASNVEIVAYLDRGFSFVGTEFQGQYDPSRHAVYWSLAELPVEARGAVPLTLLPIEQGERAIRLEARGDLNLIARHEKKVNVDALAELTFSITDDADPIEVGSMATYEIRIMNRGARADADVTLKLQLPPGLELVSSESDAATDGRGLVVFTPQAVMAARSEVVHRVRVQGVAPGTHVVKAIVASKHAPVPVTKEESTTVYADQ